jgi:hypothetical protein
MPIQQAKIIVLRVERNESGTVVNIQSDIDWSPICSPRNPNFTLCGVECRSFNNTLAKKLADNGKSHGVILNSAEAIVFNGPNINASFLQAKDILTGAKFVIPPSAMTPSGVTALKEFADRLQSFATDLHNHFVEKTRVKVITTCWYQEA